MPENLYDDPHIAEWYDATETYDDDIILIRRLIGEKSLDIIEPFCGTGRLAVPLAQDGHTVVGFDQSRAMLDRAAGKIDLLGIPQARVTLLHADALQDPWPSGFDLVLLAANCLYELGSPDDQRHCIREAFRVLRPGGRLFLDNNHMEGNLDESWTDVGTVHSDRFICADGVQLTQTRETIWFDAPRRLVRLRRTASVKRGEDSPVSLEWIQVKHPVSYLEVETWLLEAGFTIAATYGDRSGQPYLPDAPRAIFFATRPA